MMKRFISWLCALVLMLACVPASLAEGQATPKYVFMFIGDGMGNPQVTATQYYLGSIENPDSPYPVPAELSFTNFPYLGMVTTYDASSFCPDSASTATSMASGEKTLSGVINYDVTLTTPFKLITEYAKEAGKKIGVISSVSVITPPPPTTTPNSPAATTTMKSPCRASPATRWISWRAAASKSPPARTRIRPTSWRWPGRTAGPSPEATGRFAA